nr:hypothetical protein [Tanacetum cinerariifolium]
MGLTQCMPRTSRAQVLSLLPVPFLEDPFEAIKQACLVETDTESKPFEDPIETEKPESPHTVASPTLLPDSTPPTCHAEELEDSNMSGVRSTSSDSTKTLSRDHPLTHTSPTLELLEEDDEEEDEEVEESLGSDNESEDAEDEGPTEEDERAAPVVETDVGEPLRLGYGAFKRREIASREGQMPSVFEVGQGSGFIPDPERPERVSALRQPTLTT